MHDRTVTEGNLADAQHEKGEGKKKRFNRKTRGEGSLLMDKETNHCKKRDRSKSRKENAKIYTKGYEEMLLSRKKGPSVLNADSGKNFKVLKETS